MIDDNPQLHESSAPTASCQSECGLRLKPASSLLSGFCRLKIPWITCAAACRSFRARDSLNNQFSINCIYVKI